MATLTPENVDRIVADDPTPISEGDARSDRFFRHLYFIHFVLGEPWGDAFYIAWGHRHLSLPLETMREIAANWNDPWWDYFHSKGAL